MALFVDYGDCSGVVAVLLLLWVALRALGGVWSACEAWWGLMGGCCSSAAVCIKCIMLKINADPLLTDD